MKMEQIIPVLQSTPMLLFSWLEKLPSKVLMQSEKKETWNTLDVLKHLICGEQTDWIPRLKLMIVENLKGKTPTFEPFDRNSHKQNNTTDLVQLLSEFKQLRIKNLKTLQRFRLESNFSQLAGIHPDLGNVNGHQLIATWVVHDQTHIYQIARNIASPYVKEVGPWAAYLRIIQQNTYE